VRHKLNALQILFKRKYPLNLVPYGGNAWFAFPVETLQFICDYIKKHPRYMRFHRYTMLPDEIFFQTLIYNYFEKIKEEVHCIDWSRLNEPLPVVFKKDDLEQLQQSGKLFARKFDYDIDKEIFDLIDETLLCVSPVQ
jgi:hypothetical protein